MTLRIEFKYIIMTFKAPCDLVLYVFLPHHYLSPFTYYTPATLTSFQLFKGFVLKSSQGLFLCYSDRISISPLLRNLPDFPKHCSLRILYYINFFIFLEYFSLAVIISYIYVLTSLLLESSPPECQLHKCKAFIKLAHCSVSSA